MFWPVKSAAPSLPVPATGGGGGDAVVGAAPGGEAPPPELPQLMQLGQVQLGQGSSPSKLQLPSSACAVEL